MKKIFIFFIILAESNKLYSSSSPTSDEFYTPIETPPETFPNSQPVNHEALNNALTTLVANTKVTPIETPPETFPNSQPVDPQALNAALTTLVANTKVTPPETFPNSQPVDHEQLFDHSEINNLTPSIAHSKDNSTVNKEQSNENKTRNSSTTSTEELIIGKPISKTSTPNNFSCAQFYQNNARTVQYGIGLGLLGIGITGICKREHFPSVQTIVSTCIPKNTLLRYGCALGIGTLIHLGAAQSISKIQFPNETLTQEFQRKTMNGLYFIEESLIISLTAYAIYKHL